MSKLLDGVKPLVLPKYRHLMREDAAIWRRFIKQGKYLPDAVWYDVRVGLGVELPTGRPEWMATMAEYSWRKRIDIVGRAGLAWWVIECKPGAGVVALGQAVYYSMAFAAEYAHAGVVLPVVITDVVDGDVLPVFEAQRVIVLEVGLED